MVHCWVQLTQEESNKIPLLTSLILSAVVLVDWGQLLKTWISPRVVLKGLAILVELTVG